MEKEKMPWWGWGVLIFIIINIFSPSNNSTTKLDSGSPQTPTSFVRSLIEKVAMLGLESVVTKLVTDSEPAKEYVQVSVSNAGEMVLNTFFPAAFAAEHDIDFSKPENEIKQKIAEIDKKIQEDIDDCTEMVIYKGIKNQVQRLEERYSCFIAKGYTDNDVIYANSKQQAKNI
jgi:hypothetical protein